MPLKKWYNERRTEYHVERKEYGVKHLRESVSLAESTDGGKCQKVRPGVREVPRWPR